MTTLSTQLDAPTARPGTGRAALYTGRALSGVAMALLLMDAAIKLLTVPEAVAGTVELGWPASALLGIGVLQAVLWILYAVPRTAVLGALLWTGYLGGAVATHVRIGNPLLSHVLAPVYVATFLWAGLWLRDPRLRALLPVGLPARDVSAAASPPAARREGLL